MVEHHRILTKKDIEHTKKISIVEGCGYFAMDGFAGQYIIPFALKLGANNASIAIISSVPTFLAALAQLVGAKIAESTRSRKRTAATFAFLQGLTLIPLFIVPLITKNITILTIIFSIYLMLEGVLAPSWNSMMGDIVQKEDRKDYFAKRNKITMFALIISMILAGLILNAFTKINIWLGFWVLFTIAVFARTTSTILLLMYHDPINNPPPEKKERFLEFIHTLKKNNFGNFAIFKSIFNFSVMVASPFFTVYMLKNLGFSYVQFSIVVLASLAARAISNPYWGSCSKSFGTRNMLYVSSVLVATVPLIWFLVGFFFEKSPIAFWLILLVEIITGFAWGGFDLTSYDYMLQTTESSSRARMFAYFHTYFGFFNMLGGLIGAALVSYLTSLNSTINIILAILFISFVLRIVSTLLLISKVKELEVKTIFDERRLLLEIGLIRPIHTTFNHTVTSYVNIESKFEKKLNYKSVEAEGGIEKLDRKIEKMFSKPLKKKKKKKSKR